MGCSYQKISKVLFVKNAQNESAFLQKDVVTNPTSNQHGMGPIRGLGTRKEMRGSLGRICWRILQNFISDPKRQKEGSWFSDVGDLFRRSELFWLECDSTNIRWIRYVLGSVDDDLSDSELSQN